MAPPTETPQPPPPEPDNEARLRASEEKFRALIENSHDGILLISACGEIQFASPAAGRLLGHSQEDLVGRNGFDLVHPDDLARARAELAEVLEQPGGARTVVLRTRTPDGSVRWLECVGTNLLHNPAVAALVVNFRDTTERKQAELALRRYQLLSQHTQDIVLFIRPEDARIVEANDAAVAAYGYPREELLTLTVFDLRDPSTTHMMTEQLHRADDRGITFTTRHCRRDGTTFPVEVSSRGAVFEGGRLLLSLIRDISEREEADRAVRESEERYRDLFENANDTIYTVSLDGRFTSLNRQVEALLGYRREELLGRDVEEVIHPASREASLEARRRKLEGRESKTTYELLAVRKDGLTVPVEVSSRLVMRGGLPVGTQGIARDIRDRKAAEREVRRSELRFRKLFEQSPLSVQLLAPDGTALRVNRAWERLWGARAEDHLAGGYNLLRDERLRALGVMPLIERAFLVGETVAVPPTPFVPPGGEHRGQERWLRAFLSPVKDEDGRVEEVVLIHEDITDQRQAEESLREADRRKNEFMAMLAHELRNPLAPIRNAVGVLRMMSPPVGEAARMCDMIERQTSHLARLVDDLLDVSRVTRGKVLLRRDRVDLVALVSTAVGDCRAMVAGGGVALGLSLPPGPLWVEGDATRLAQVVGNLLHNAGKFTPAGQRVTVTLAEEGGAAVLRVRDTGIGMGEGMRKRLFEPFSQEDSSLERSRGGLGLGLALVRGLAEMHGGSVSGHSDGPGEGSEFVVRLPLLRVAPGTPGASGVTSRLRGRPMRVLIVEDNRDAAESLQLLLQMSGHQVTVAHTGAAGLAAAGRDAPEVVLCDIGLAGGMDGYAVARALRAGPGRSAMLIALSGYGHEDDPRSREAGFDRHLVKPVEPSTVLGLLAALPPRHG